MNLFERAVKEKFRFSTVKGEITVEQLMDLPLTSRNGFDLDTVARDINRTLKAVTEESFVTVSKNQETLALGYQLDLVKAIIQEKLDRRAARESAAAKAAERQRLLELLDRKKDQQLEQLTPEEIQKRIDDLS